MPTFLLSSTLLKMPSRWQYPIDLLSTQDYGILYQENRIDWKIEKCLGKKAIPNNSPTVARTLPVAVSVKMLFVKKTFLKK